MVQPIGDPPRTGHRPTIRKLVGIVLRNAIEHDSPAIAAQLSFYLLFAFLPFLLFLSALLGFVFGVERSFYLTWLANVGHTMPPSAYELVQRTLNELKSRPSNLKLSFGLAMSLWIGSSGMVAIIKGLNVTYGVKEQRRRWRRRLIAVCLTVCLGFIALLATALVFGGQAAHWFFNSLSSSISGADSWLRVVGWSATVVSMLFAATIVYRFGPDFGGKSREAALPGAVIAVVGWLVASIGIRLYIDQIGAPHHVYGSLTAAMLLLLWLYFCSASILVGGEVNAAIGRWREGM